GLGEPVRQSLESDRRGPCAERRTGGVLRGGLPLKLLEEHGRVVGINVLKHRLASEGFGEVVDETPEVSSIELLSLGFDALVDEEALDDRFEGRVPTQLVPPQCS